MVAQLETETHNPVNNFFEKKIAALLIKVVINSSIRNKMRTREDWQNFHRERKTIEDDCVVKTTIDGLSDEEREILRCKNSTSSWDRYIVIDYQTADEQIYHCGASSKDGGNKVTTITAVTDGAIYHPVIDQLIQNPVLTLR